MDKFTNKRPIKPTAVCQYGKQCHLENPHHFMEYTHEHLDKIIQQNSATNNTAQYHIPDDMSSQKDLILEQIKIVNELFPTLSVDPSAKEVKPDETTAQSSASSSPVVSSLVSSSIDVCVQSKSTEVKPNSASTSTTQTNSTPKANIHDYIKVVNPKGKMAQKLAASKPYNYFLTCITSSPKTHSEPLSVTFQEILDPSLGELECSVQINFMVGAGWLLGQYYFAGVLNKPLLILYGSGSPELETISQKKPQVTAHLIKMPTQFASHHTKMMLLGYTDGSMRVVVSTANLYENDWHNRTQGLWMSDKLEPMPKGSDIAAGESPTEFRNELLKYLSSYKLPQLEPWLVRIRKTSFEPVNVFLVTSIPGTYTDSNSGYPHGHGRVAHLISEHTLPINDTSPIIAQSSALGNFGPNPNAWLTSEFLNSFRRESQPVGWREVPRIRIIYPSFSNVANSHDGLKGGGCLPYGGQVHQKQPWLNDFLYQWRADCRYRSKAMPHIKTYCRWSEKKLFWFILTSANLSKSAWGTLSKAKTSPTLRISNYEAGVVFMPKFVTNTSYFSMDESDSSTPVFPSLYDTSLTKYEDDDVPFLCDIKVRNPKGGMAQKLAASKPYNYFLTCIRSSPKTHSEPLSITFQEILDPSLGELECSVQINFMVDAGWLLGQYYFAGVMNKPLLILYGCGSPELGKISRVKPQVRAYLVRMPAPFATHQTKMMLLGYTDGSMRVVVSTANLNEDDWYNRTQGLWMSDKLEPMPDGSDTGAGESPTEFRNELLKYLSSYDLPQLEPWLLRIRKTSFESVNVFLVTSIPGIHADMGLGYPHGHGRVAHILSEHSAPIENNSPIIAQISVLGNYGANPNAWLTSEFVHSFRLDSQQIGQRMTPNIHIIYPSLNNVENSHDGILGGECLPYRSKTHQEQPWLNDFLYQWRADCRFRSNAMPHIKTYCRWSEKKLFWFILTSAGLSKAAWGTLAKARGNPILRINNYEAGVIFLPKFVTNTSYFSIDESDSSTPVFPSLYEIPLTKYEDDDVPFFSDILRTMRS